MDKKEIQKRIESIDKVREEMYNNEGKDAKKGIRNIVITMLVGIWLAAIGFWIFCLLEIHNILKSYE